MFTKIKLENFKDKDVSSITANPLLGDATTNKALFDKSAKEVLMPAFNNLIDELLSSSAPEHIGAEGGTLKDLLDGVKQNLSDVPGTIDKKVAEAIAKVVANAPENLDTLKKLSDWIREHEVSADKMNSAIEATRTALTDKVDKEEGKVLSEENFSKAEKDKLGGIQEGAQVNVIEDIQINVGAATANGKTVNLKIPTPQEIIEDNKLVDNQKLSAELEKKVSKDGNKVLSDNNYTTADMEKLAGVEEGAQVNKIEGISYNGTQLDVQDKTVNIETYRGMLKLGEKELASATKDIELKGFSLTRGYAKLTWPEDARNLESARPNGYLYNNEGARKQVTSYPSGGVGSGKSAYFIIDFEVFSNVSRISSYGVSSDPTQELWSEGSVNVTDKTVNTGGTVSGVYFYFSSGGNLFPAGTKLELWGE